MNKKLPININDFTELIEQNYIYVDKTEIIYSMINLGKNYFICRPRRFGKSLLVSTFEALFSGNKNLFKNLWIYDRYDFKKYPIIKLDFSKLKSKNAESFELELTEIMLETAKSFNINISQYLEFNAKLSNLIELIHAGHGPIVILIDEYDDPIIKNIKDVFIADGIRNSMRDFFKIIKAQNKFLKFIFVTGVTKFPKETVFSGANNLTDLTLDELTCTLFGYTPPEIDYYFAQYIQDFANKQNLSLEDTKESIKSWYNGYRFSTNPNKVFNPQSIANCLLKQRLENYWIETATTQFVLETIKKNPLMLEDIEEKRPDKEYLTTLEIESVQLVPVLFQTGYLTIKNFFYENPEKKEGIYYQIGAPNLEIEKTLKRCLLSVYINFPIGETNSILRNLSDAIAQQNWNIFFKKIEELLSNVPYQLHISQEKYYHSIIQIICSLLPFRSSSEISTDKGRIDLVIETPEHINIFEFKLNSTSNKAIEQIESKKYYQKYLSLNKRISLLGVNFTRIDNRLQLEWVCKIYLT